MGDFSLCRIDSCQRAPAELPVGALTRSPRVKITDPTVIHPVQSHGECEAADPRRLRCLRAPRASANRWGICATLAGALLLIGACATLPREYPRTESMAFQAHESTAVGKDIAGLAAQHPGESGFALIRRGRPAFTARVVLADLAQRSLDVQYFIWESDATGRILVDRLIRAADRGVRVRILVDDANLKDRDAPIAALDAHPNVEIRLFNPFAHRGSRIFGFVTDFDRVNHRMHNKLMVMDNALAIVGGRNMSNPYFEVDASANFRDLDIAAVGPVVRDLSKVFDRFWNGEWSVPIAALVDRRYDEADLRDHAQRMRAAIAKGGYPHPLDQDVAALTSELATILRALVWAPGYVVFDDPASINDPSLRVMHKLLFQRFDRLQTELLIESAYFIPLDGGVAKLKELVERGVRVRILTNSLASNDVIAAFAGYASSREALIRSGVELHELRPEPGPVRKRLIGLGGRSGLHTKALVFDRKDVFIGSFNLDARSSAINTEAGLYVESPALAAQVVEYMNEGVDPDVSYQVQLDQDGKLFWIADDEGTPLRYDTDPMTTLWQRFLAGVIRMLPIASHL
jgi:cardiolipin synthase C